MLGDLGNKWINKWEATDYSRIDLKMCFNKKSMSAGNNNTNVICHFFLHSIKQSN